MLNQNQWLAHVAAYRKANPTVSYKDALKSAKATYKQPVVETQPPEQVVEVPAKKSLNNVQPLSLQTKSKKSTQN